MTEDKTSFTPQIMATAGVSYFFLNEDHSDLKFRVGDRIFPVHSRFLVKRIRYFRAMLTTGFAEENQKIIDLKETNADDFHLFLSCIYGVAPDFKDIPSGAILGLIHLADFYLVDDLKSALIKVIDHRMDANVLEVFSHACVHSKLAYTTFVDELLNRCCVKIKDNFLTLLDHEDFLSLDYETLKAMFSLKPDNFSEIQLFKSLLSWISSNPDETREDILDIIEFDKISVKNIVNIVKKRLTDTILPLLRKKLSRDESTMCLTMKNLDLCLLRREHVTSYNSVSQFPRSVRGFSDSGKMKYCKVDLPANFYVNTVLMSMRNHDNSKTFRVMICILSDEDPETLEPPEMGKWNEVPVIRDHGNSYRAEVTFEKRAVRRIRFLGLQDTSKKIFRLDITCYYANGD